MLCIFVASYRYDILPDEILCPDTGRTHTSTENTSSSDEDAPVTQNAMHSSASSIYGNSTYYSYAAAAILSLVLDTVP